MPTPGSVETTKRLVKILESDVAGLKRHMAAEAQALPVLEQHLADAKQKVAEAEKESNYAAKS
jgi:hypothetical protein